MFEVKIYIETDNKCPLVTLKYYGYILECKTLSGREVTKEGFGCITGTYHQTTLTALAEAMGRINQSCIIDIYTPDMFVMNMIRINLRRWAGNHFMSTKDKPVANREEWMKVWSLAENHILQEHPGRSEYTNWLQTEMRKRM